MLSRRKKVEKKRFWRYTPVFELVSGEVQNAVRSADGPDAVPEMRIELNDGRLFQIKGSSLIPQGGDEVSVVMMSAEEFASDVVIGILNHEIEFFSICEFQISEFVNGSFFKPIASTFSLIYFFGSSEKALNLSAMLFAIGIGKYFDPTITIPVGLASFIIVIKISLIAIRSRVDARRESLRLKIRSLIGLPKVATRNSLMKLPYSLTLHWADVERAADRLCRRQGDLAGLAGGGDRQQPGSEIEVVFAGYPDAVECRNGVSRAEIDIWRHDDEWDATLCSRNQEQSLHVGSCKGDTMTERQLVRPKGMNWHHNSESDIITWSNRELPSWRFAGIGYSIVSAGLVLVLLNGIVRAAIGDQPVANILSIILPGILLPLCVRRLLRFTWTESIEISDSTIVVAYSGVWTPKRLESAGDRIRALCLRETYSGTVLRESSLGVDFKPAGQRWSTYMEIAFVLECKLKRQLFECLREVFTRRRWDIEFEVRRNG